MADSHVFLDRRQHKLSPLRCRPASARASANPHFVLSSLRESCTCDISGPCFFSCNLGGALVQETVIHMVRFKNRYMLFDVSWKDGKFDDSINEGVLLAAFRDSLQLNFGDHGLGSVLASLQVKYYNPVSSQCVVRCSRDEYRQVWGSLCLITEIKHRAVSLRLLHLTGAVAACQRAAEAGHAAATAGRRLSAQQAKAAEEAAGRLQAMVV